MYFLFRHYFLFEAQFNNLDLGKFKKNKNQLAYSTTKFYQNYNQFYFLGGAICTFNKDNEYIKAGIAVRMAA